MVGFGMLLVTPYVLMGATGAKASGKPRSNINVGVFVGVNEFTTKHYKPLRYAVNDAVAYAYLLTSQRDDGLGLIEPTNCFLALAGKPTTSALITQLDELRERGAIVTGASAVEINTAIDQASQQAVDQSGMVVLTLSTHGYMYKDSFRVLPSDGNPGGFTDIQAKELERMLKEFVPTKRILIFDVCQTLEGPLRGPSVTDLGDLLSRFKQAEGFVVLNSCSAGEGSLEDEEKQHGVFSRYLLEALRGSAGDSQGIITISSAFAYAWSHTTVRAPQIKPGGRKQTPSIAGYIDAPLPTMARTNLIYTRLNENRVEMNSAVKQAKACLLKAVNPDGDPPFRGSVVDQAWDVFAKAEFPIRTDLAQRIQEELGPGSPQGRRYFLTWWSNTFTKELAISNLLAAATVQSPVVAPTNAINEVPKAVLTTVWTNSLGMEFRRIPGRTNLWLCIWETRVGDYHAFLKDKKLPLQLSQHTNEPVAEVSWNDACDFCDWLTKRESGFSPPPKYRLPTDAEWSLVVGLDEPAGKTIDQLVGLNLDVYPWGKWPPGDRVGNYADTNSLSPIEARQDSYRFVSPVGLFPANKFGFFDLGGNVWEWTDSDYEQGKACRGGAFTLTLDSHFSAEQQLRSSFRYPVEKTTLHRAIGFRVAVERRL